MGDTYIIDNFLDTCRNTSMLSKVTSSKTSACFICGEEFPLADLTVHEKACLDYIKSSDSTDGTSNDASSNHSFPSAYNSNLSARSSSSSASGDSNEKKYSRCYICGTDVPNYLSSIHEKNCKKNWETGLLNSICTPARKSKSKGDLSSLSRSGSRENLLKSSTDSSFSTPDLVKAKSTTNIRHAVNTELNNRENRPRHLKSSSQRKAAMNESRSMSTTNLAVPKTGSNYSLNSSSETFTSKSSQDLRRGSDGKGNKKADPQYVICQICGKLYSIHSISIHQRTCERTYKRQKEMGTNSEYKIKSKSLADLSKPGVRRPTSASAKTKQTTPVKTPTRPATARSANRLRDTSTLSKSTGNIGPTYTRQLLVKKEIVNDENSSTNNGLDESKMSPGLRTCYLCGQLYGTRSLPIHEKQCLKKWERAQEEEKKKKKKIPKKDIQIMAFGRDKFENDENSEVNSEQGHSVQTITPSGLFGVPSPLKNKEQVIKTDDTKDKPIPNGDLASEDKSKTTNSSPKPKFVACVYCYKQYGLHSISIHEKNCREKLNIEKQAKERITNSNNKKSSTIGDKKKLSKSVGDISLTLQDAYSSHNDILQLIKCDECARKFLKSDIEKHRAHCRVSVL